MCNKKPTHQRDIYVEELLSIIMIIEQLRYPKYFNFVLAVTAFIREP